MAYTVREKGELPVYRIIKENGKTIVMDWQDHVIWSSPDDAYILYTPTAGLNKGNPATARVGALSDEQVLMCLANAIKLSI